MKAIRVLLIFLASYSTIAFSGNDSGGEGIVLSPDAIDLIEIQKTDFDDILQNFDIVDKIRTHDLDLDLKFKLIAKDGTNTLFASDPQGKLFIIKAQTPELQKED